MVQYLQCLIHIALNIAQVCGLVHLKSCNTRLRYSDDGQNINADRSLKCTPLCGPKSWNRSAELYIPLCPPTHTLHKHLQPVSASAAATPPHASSRADSPSPK